MTTSTIQLSLLRDRVTIRRQSTVASSTTGVKKQVWGDVAANVPASIQSRSARVILAMGGEKDEAMFMGFFLPTADVRVGDEIVNGGQKLLALFVANRRNHHLEVELRTNEE